MSDCSGYQPHQFKRNTCRMCYRSEADHPPIPDDPHQWSVSDVSRWLALSNLQSPNFHETLQSKNQRQYINRWHTRIFENALSLGQNGVLSSYSDLFYLSCKFNDSYSEPMTFQFSLFYDTKRMKLMTHSLRIEFFEQSWILKKTLRFTTIFHFFWSFL